MTPATKLVYDALVRAAETGATCPTNADLAVVVDTKSTSPVRRAIDWLKKFDFITVESTACTCSITITETGKTAVRNGTNKAHSRGGSVFSPADDAFLRANYRPNSDEGMPAELIAQRFGRTKGSIIGRANRLGLSRKRAPSHTKSPGRPRQSPLRAIPRKEAPATPVSFKRCQYITGEPSADDSCKCGKLVVLGSSYCAEHHAICWQKPVRQDTRPHVVR